MKAKAIALGGQKSGEVTLNDKIFGLPLRKDILQRVVEWQRAKKQAGTHNTRRVSDIRGTGAKPFRQKGTGNARQGSRYSVHMRGGGTIGPVTRSHAYNLPKKIRQLGLKTALSAKQSDGKLFVAKDLKLKDGKTKELIKLLESNKLDSVLFIGGSEVDEKFAKAARNLRSVQLLPQHGANVYDILRHDNVVLSEDAVKQLEERLS